MNRIAHLFGVNTVAISKWIRAFRYKLCIKIELPQKDKVIVMEVDEWRKNQLILSIWGMVKMIP
jgi:transposase-like protein